jgi:uroporphyrinogen decarboxylase
MTPRQRVLAALDHQQPDRAPVDFGAHRSSGIAAIAYRKLRKALKLPERMIRVYDPLQQLAIIDEDVLERFRVDTIELGRGFALDDKDWADWVLPDGSPCQVPVWALPDRGSGEWLIRSVRSGRVLAKMRDGALGFEQCYWPFLNADDLDRLHEALSENAWTAVQPPPGPLVSGTDGQRLLAEGARALRARTDRAIVALFDGSLLEIGQSLYRIDNFLMRLASDPDRTSAFLDRLVAIHLANLETYLAAVGPHIDIVAFADDLGMQSGPQISLAMYRAMFMPRHARLWRRAKELAGVKVMLHSCGGIRPLLSDLIEAGIDAVNPVQINCAGMDAAGLKADFGDKITLWGGGCDTRFLRAEAARDDVQRHVRGQVEILNRGGGFVFQPVHNILAGVPAENVMAMFDAVR